MVCLAAAYWASFRPAHASGFFLYEQSARALGQAGAAAASATDPSAAWFDPAALAYAPRWGATLSSGLVVASTRFTAAADGAVATSAPGPQLVPSVFGHLRIHDRVQIGLALLAPFGLRVEWPSGWTGAEQSLLTKLRVLAVNLSVAMRLTDRFAVAVGGSLLRGDVDLATELGAEVGGRADLSGWAWGFGLNAALLYRPLPDRLTLALTYRTRTTLAFDGHADFSPQMSGFEETFADQRVSAQVTLPDALSFGVTYRPMSRLALSAQVDRVLWSAFKELAIDFEKPTTPDRLSNRGARDPFTGRLGAEWLWPALDLRARGGLILEQSSAARATNIPAAPDGNRIGLCTGLGHGFGRIEIDLAYLYAHFFDAPSDGPTARPPGTYRTRAHVVALGVTLH